jgi:ribosomal protein S27AE
MSQEVYDDWGESIDEDSKGNRGPGGKKWGLLYRIDENPVRIHFGYPEKPYVHPKTGQAHPFRTGKRHFIPGAGKKGKGAFIECGVDHGEPCVVCAYRNPAQFNLENVAPDARMKQFDPKTYYAVSGWIEEDFHLVTFNKDEGDGTYNKRMMCEGRGCQWCEDGWPMVFGNKFYTEISPGQWRHSIHEINTQIQNSHCACGGDIYVLRFECANCGVIPVIVDDDRREVVMDVSTFCDCGSDQVGLNLETAEAECSACGRSWSALYTMHKNIYSLTRSKQKCGECGYEGYLKPVRFCTTEGCEIKPMGVFDCQLTVRMTGTKKEKRLVIDNYVVQEPDPRLFDVEYQGGAGDEWAPKIVDSHKKPLDLDYLLRPDSTDWQAKLLNKADPFNAAGRTTGAARYARYQGDTGGDETAA